MKSLNELNKFYFNVLRRDLLDLEKERKPIVRTAMLLIVVILLVTFFASSMFNPISHGKNYEGWQLVWIRLCLSLFFWVPAVMIVPYVFANYYQPYVNYKKFFKEKIIRALVDFIDADLVYNQEGVVPVEIFTESMLYSKPDYYSGNDHVKGIICQTQIEFSEVNATARGERKSGNSIIFSGLFFVADFNKNLQWNVVVHPENIFMKSLGMLDSMLAPSSGISIGPRLVNLEDPEFEKLFAVFGYDQIESRYILSPALMSRLTAFRKKSKRNVHVSFVGSKVYVSIFSDRSLFSPRLFRSLLDFEQVEAYYRDLELMVGIVEQLNLNTRIWSKQ